MTTSRYNKQWFNIWVRPPTESKNLEEISHPENDRVDRAMGVRDVFCKMLSGSSNTSSVFMEEEQSHPWLRPVGLADGFCSPPPLGVRYSLRVIHNFSQGQLDDESGHIFAADPWWRLDTRAERHDALKLHSNYQDWSRRSPLISADASPFSTKDRARKLVTNGRGQVRVSLIDNMVRLRAGLPFFSAIEEMQHYGVDDPYHQNYAFYEHEILYPYVITSEEIVATWKWSSIEAYLETHSIEEWVENRIKAELNRHEQSSLSRWRAQHPVINVSEMAIKNA